METGSQGRPRLTAKGAATRQRLVTAAAELMYRNGVEATTLDDVRLATGTSKSQFYRYFPRREDLIMAVVQLRGEQVLAGNARRLSKLDSFRGLDQWRDAVVQKVTLQRGAFGCELGSLAGELADVDEDARVVLAGLFASWEQLLADGFDRMRENGLLRADADSPRLASAVIAALQGGYLMAQVAHDPGAMRIALDMALGYVRTFASDAGSEPAPRKQRSRATDPAGTQGARAAGKVPRPDRGGRPARPGSEASSARAAVA